MGVFGKFKELIGIEEIDDEEYIIVKQDDILAICE